MVYVFLADGFEEIEALCPVDIMRRAGIEVRTTAIGTRREVRGAHNITVSTDMLFSELHIEGTPELLMLPGGMPGATHLREHDGLCTLLKTASAAGTVSRRYAQRPLFSVSSDCSRVARRPAIRA